MIKFFVLFFVISIRSLYADILEEFYILPMGQGNAQLVIYEQGSKKVGVLYDLGSKSLQTHPKFMNRGGWKIKYKPTLEKVESQIDRLSITPKKIGSYIGLSHQFQSPEPSREITVQSQQLMTVDGKLNSLQQGQHKEALELFISDLLNNLSHLFIFISHSDQDHINYLNHKVIPDTVPVTILFCGDWFGNVGCRNEETNATRDVQNVLRFLKERLQKEDILTQFNFTYYQDFIIDGRGTLLNDFIKSTLKTSADIGPLIDSLKTLCSRDSLSAPIPEFYSGPFIHLYSSLFQEQDRSRETTETTSMMSLIEKVKSNIYVWSMNHLTDDINGQSIVISCFLPSLDLSVVLTGDAQHSTFQRICSEYRGRDFRSILNDITPNHLVLLMLPHHGSRDNNSGSALRFFQPDIFGIAAGDGSQHGHPSYQLIEILNQNYFLLKSQNNFMGKYKKLKSGIDFVAIQDKTLKLIKSNRRTVPFLCPNLYGCIKWDKDGISTNFDNILEYGDKEYKILYTSHVWECEAIPLKRLNLNSVLIVRSVEDSSEEEIKFIAFPMREKNNYYLFKKQSTDELFAGVPVENKIYFYRILES